MSKGIASLLVLMLAFSPLLMAQEDLLEVEGVSTQEEEQEILPEDANLNSEGNHLVDVEAEGSVFTLDDIVLDVGDKDSDRLRSIFSWRDNHSVLDGNTKIKNLMQEAAFQSKVGNLEGAVEIYEKVLELDEDNPLANFNRATALVQIGRFEEALEVLAPLMEKYPDNYMLKNNSAWVYATADNISIRSGEKALSLARDALLLAPGDYHIWHTLSEAYFVSAMYEKAQETAEIALRMAISQGEDNNQLQNLSNQVRKSRQAVATMSIME